ncbi:MAG: 23S rRNA (adenine(2503)-C(2))-methyltransferase RlmN [Vicingaceae bacterium]
MTPESKINIRELDPIALKTAFTEFNEPSYRAKQVYDWLWTKNAAEFSNMTNLPKDLISKLEAVYFIPVLKDHRVQISTDGTIKNAFKLHDDQVIEGVLIPQKKRMTACISSQVGCSLTCKFCATGQMKLNRNLSAFEMYDQVVRLNQQALDNYERHLSNVVYMGMGEPLLNYKEMLRSTEMLISKEGMGMSPKRITVSTAGIAKMIRRLGDDKVKFQLALSLHAANDKKRNSIMPINESNNLEVLSESLVYFQEKTGTRVTFEYILLQGLNDDLADAKELAEFCKAVACKINLIEYNPIQGAHFKKSRNDKLDAFSEYLESKNLVVNVRRNRGKDIDAACGQLANKGVKS